MMISKQKSFEIDRILSRFSKCITLNELFVIDKPTNNKGTRGHSCKLKKVRCKRDIVRYFFSNKVINRRNGLDQSAVDAPSIDPLHSGPAHSIY